MKQPELRFGRPAIAWNCVSEKMSGLYIYNDGHTIYPHEVYITDLDITGSFRNVESDPYGMPMNGDEVEVSKNRADWHKHTYVGKCLSGEYITDGEEGLGRWTYVRFPQQSKREQVDKLLSEYARDDSMKRDEFLNQIEQIYTEDK